MKRYFGIENFDGNPLPENWDAICIFLNQKYDDGEDAEDIWNKYWNGAYDDAPEAVMSFYGHDYNDLAENCAKVFESDATIEDIRNEMMNDKIYDVVPEDQFDRFCEAIFNMTRSKA